MHVRGMTPRGGAHGLRHLAARLGAAVLLVALSQAASASPAAASVTIGQVAPPQNGCVVGYDDIQGTVSSGNSYVVPGTGTITSWASWGGPIFGGKSR